MRVCLERFDWASACWRRSYGTLRALTAELVPQSLRQFDDDRARRAAAVSATFASSWTAREPSKGPVASSEAALDWAP
eukprot:7381064-Prymnesium_polylepis.1